MLKTQKQRSFGIMLSGLSACVLLFLLMNIFSPEQFVPAGVLAIFGLIYIMCFAIMFGLCGLIASLFNIFIGKSECRLSFYENYVCLAIVSMAPVVVLAIQSIRDVSIKELGLIFLLAILTCFYLSKR